ncbi:MAG: ChaN family lipoprotein, partial [Candidatus Aminicenantes bacterium]|nr:ChaN family lipoprotein [Candidatus Aminicenantes bacterium]
KISETELLQKTGWYAKTSLNFAYTRLVLDIIKKYKIKVIGLNIPRDILRKVSRQGYDSLPAEEKKLFPTIAIYNREHEYFIKTVFGAFAVQVPLWFKNVYTAQKCWDTVMAESMRELLASATYKGYKGVIIAGSNHAAYKLGIPFRYNKASKKTALTTIVPVFLPEAKKESSAAEENPMMKMLGQSLPPAAVYSRGIADYVFAISKPDYEFFPAFGMSVEMRDGKIAVTAVEKKSIAEQNGIKQDDVILAVDDVETTSLEQLRTILALKNWDDSVGLKITKKIEIKKPPKEETKEEIKE